MINRGDSICNLSVTVDMPLIFKSEHSVKQVYLNRSGLDNAVNAGYRAMTDAFLDVIE